MLRATVAKLNPLHLWHNPVLLVAEVATAVGLLGNVVGQHHAATYDWVIATTFLVTLMLATFAEAYAEARGKAWADVLRRTKTAAQCKLLQADGATRLVDVASLRRHDRVVVTAGETIPGDGTVIAGVGSVDESTITGESAPVLKQCQDVVNGGTILASDQLVIELSELPHETFVDRMITLMEGGQRERTPHETALTALMSGMSAVFVVVVMTLVALSRYDGIHSFTVPTAIGLLVCLIPLPAASLLSATSIGAMHRASSARIMLKHRRAVEAAADVNTLILDKTGTLTLGNRTATEFLPLPGITRQQLAEAALWASNDDTTPEGRSTVALAQAVLARPNPGAGHGTPIPFSPETRMSGVDLDDGRKIRKGAVSVIQTLMTSPSEELDTQAGLVSRDGSTPLAVAVDDRIYGLIRLKDLVKSGLQERFSQLRAMGIRTVMATGDNRITASVIAAEAGVDTFMAEAKPRDKIRLIVQEQAAGRCVAMAGDGTDDVPALEQADVGLAMNTGSRGAKEISDMVDLDSNPAKFLDMVIIGRQWATTRGALLVFSVVSAVAKTVAAAPAWLGGVQEPWPALAGAHAAGAGGALLSVLIFNALSIPALIPVALRGIKMRSGPPSQILLRNLWHWGVLGMAAAFAGIWLIEQALSLMGLW